MFMLSWLTLLTYLVKFTLIIGISFYPWKALFFPVCVFTISALILVQNFRDKLDQDCVTLEGQHNNH
jgi:hypothetical protein